MAQTNTAREFSLFGSYEYGTAAPQLEPVYEPEYPDKKQPARKAPVHKQKKKTHTVSKQDIHATRASLVKSVGILFVVAVIFSIVCAAIYLNVKLDETANAIYAVQSDIEIAKSENTRLSSSLEGMVSINKIEDYAENVLGMVKLENYKITYFDNADANHVVISGGKSYDDRQTFSEKIRALLEYIF